MADNDKSQLLSQLALEKEPASSGTSFFTFILIALLFAGLGAGSSWYLTDAQAKQNQSKLQTQINELQRANPESQTSLEDSDEIPSPTAILNASGYITASRVATVSTEIMGLIRETNIEEGMVVQQGQILARLNDDIATVNLELAEASLEANKTQLISIEADIDEAKRIVNRISSLKSDRYGSEAELTSAQTVLAKAKAAYKSTQAQIRVSELEVKRQQKRLNQHTIKAPFGGVITVKNAQPGELVSPGSVSSGGLLGFCTIVDMESLEIQVDVNESFIGKVYPGQQVNANLDAYPDWDIPASVVAIIPKADRGKATVAVRIKIEQPDERILPDMGVNVAFAE